MAFDFNELKKLSGAPSELENLAKEFEKLQRKSYEDDDDTYWYPSVDGAGNSVCLLRYLPAPPGERVPFIREFRYSFKNPVTNQWYINNSLETIGQIDPVSELWSDWWNRYGKDDERVKMLSRIQAYVSNILIIKDGMNSENSGKVKRFRFGKKIFDKLQAKMAPEFDDVEPVNPFDPWKGMDFRLVIKKKAGFRNYDDSEFGPPKAMGDDAFIENVWRQCHSLQEILDPKRFKSYDELKQRLYRVLGLNLPTVVYQSSAAVDRSVITNDPRTRETFGETLAAAKGEEKPASDTPPWESDDKPVAAPKTNEDDERLAFLKRLADS